MQTLHLAPEFAAGLQLQALTTRGLRARPERAVHRLRRRGPPGRVAQPPFPAREPRSAVSRVTTTLSCERSDELLGALDPAPPAIARLSCGRSDRIWREERGASSPCTTTCGCASGTFSKTLSKPGTPLMAAITSRSLWVRLIVRRPRASGPRARLNLGSAGQPGAGKRTRTQRTPTSRHPSAGRAPRPPPPRVTPSRARTCRAPL